MIDSIENQCIVTSDPLGSKVLADLTFSEGASSLNFQINGTTTLTVINALSLITMIQSEIKRGFSDYIKTTPGI